MKLQQPDVLALLVTVGAVKEKHMCALSVESLALYEHYSLSVYQEFLCQFWQT